MSGILFASDLDNTLLFSYRHRAAADQCVEYLEGREQGFCTQKSLELLVQVGERARLIPITTRSVEQYRRINWPESCTPRHAVTTNGGILLIDGVSDPEWKAETDRLTLPWREELLALEYRLPEAPMLKRFRMVDGLYLFAACDNSESAQAGGAYFTGSTSLDVAVSGRKVYFFPPPLNKGEALRRLRERFRPDRTICAGDSVIDVPMLLAADVAILPDAGLLPEKSSAVLKVHQGEGRFPDFVLESVLNEIKNRLNP